MIQMSMLIGQLKAVDTIAEEIIILNSLLDKVFSNQKTSTEIIALSSLSDLKHRGSEVGCSLPQICLGNGYKSVTTTHQLCDCDLDYLVSYAFERRFGWSEADSFSDSHCRRVSKMRRLVVTDVINMAANVQEDLRFKTCINENLDRFIDWLAKQPLSVALLTSFYKAISGAQTKAVVRNQTLIHVMEWLSRTECLHNHYFNHIKAIIVLGLTDIWSAIRNATVSRLSRVVQHLSLANVDVLFTELVAICEGSSSSWKSIEGSLMGISAIIGQFQWVGVISEPSAAQLSDSGLLGGSNIEYILKFGGEALKVIPEFIRGHIKELVYSLLAHPQLSVRENAVKAYTVYISRCDFQEAFLSLDTVVYQLSQGTTFEGHSVSDSNGTYDFDITLLPGFSFMDAYKAEGLLSLCVHLVKHIPPGCFIPDWPLYCSTFSLYLMHPASTVRQTASAIFKFIVAKDCSNPLLLKLILHGLVSHWSPGLTTLDGGSQSQVVDSSQTSRVSIEDLVGSHILSNDFDRSAIYSTWQWREGRLLTYELLLQFLIKNHLVYTFGPSQPVSSPPVDASTVKENLTDNPKPSRTLHQSFKVSHHGDLKDSKYRRVRSRSLSSAAASSASQFLSSSFDAQQSVILRHCLRCSCLAECRGVVTTKVEPNQVTPHADGTDVNCHEDVLSKSETYAGRHSIATCRLSVEDLARLTKTCCTAATVTEEATDDLDEPIVPKERERVDSTIGSRLWRARTRHRTYFNLNSLVSGGSSANSAAPGGQFVSSLAGPTVSLLAHSRELDYANITDSLETLSAASCNKRRNSFGKRAAWYSDLQLDSLGSMLIQILHQCIECLADSSWELRRMSSQLLPCAVEVLRWYDVSLLMSLCNRSFTGLTTTALEYGMALTVKYSLQHAVNLQNFMSCLTPQSQFSSTNKKVIYRIISGIRHSRDIWSAACLNALRKRAVIDKISMVAVEIILMNQAHFYSIDRQSTDTLEAVFNTIANIFCKANTSHPLSADLMYMSSFTDLSVTQPNEFLSCSTKLEIKNQLWMQQVEKVLLTDIRHMLLLFVRSTKCCHMTAYFTLLIAYVEKYINTDDSLVKVAMDCIAVLSTTIVTLLDDVNSVNKDIVQASTSLGWRGLCSIVSHKAVSVTILKQVLDLCHLLIFVMSPIANYLFALLQAVCSKLHNEQQSDTGQSYLNGATYANLTLLSNDIRPVVTSGGDELEMTDDEEDDVLGHSMHEIQLLSASAGSGSALSPRSKASSSNSSMLDVKQTRPHRISATSWDSDNDWSDSEQQKPSEFREILSQFHRRLHASMLEKGLLPELTTCVKMLPLKDQRLVETLLTCHL